MSPLHFSILDNSFRELSALASTDAFGGGDGSGSTGSLGGVNAGNNGNSGGGADIGGVTAGSGSSSDPAGSINNPSGTVPGGRDFSVTNANGQAVAQRADGSWGIATGGNGGGGGTTSTGGSTSGSSCFIAGTKVLMADGTEKNIEDLVPGDVVQGENGVKNTVLELGRPFLANRSLYSINGGPYFVTHEHPLRALVNGKEEWVAIDPSATKVENPKLVVYPLQIGTILLMQNGREVVTSIKSKSGSYDEVLYNPSLVGNDHTYYADGYLAHNVDPKENKYAMTVLAAAGDGAGLRDTTTSSCTTNTPPPPTIVVGGAPYCPSGGGSGGVVINYDYVGSKSCSKGTVSVMDGSTLVQSFSIPDCNAGSHSFSGLQINHSYGWTISYFDSSNKQIATLNGQFTTQNCSTATVPTGLKASCPVGGGAGAVSWNPVTGAKYMLRVDYTANPWVGDCSKTQNAGDVCKDNLTTTSYNTTFVNGGTYNIWVHSLNSAGVWSNPASITFTCNGAPANNPPTVNITTPNDCAVVTTGTNTNIAATAADADGTVSSVKFEYRTGTYRKGFFGSGCSLTGTSGWTTITTDASAPYTSILNNIPGGGVEIRATATDNKGATGQDSVVVNSLAGKPQCSDGIDNDGDGKTDTNDPDCHTDGNAGNPGSYDPNDNDESGAGRCVANQGQACTSAANNKCSPPETNSGTIQCDGSCSATTPTDAECSLPNISCATPGGACSKLINQGNSCLIEWDATNATSCSVSGPGLNQTGLPTTGSVNTPQLNVTSLYTITCYNGPTVFTTRTFTCRINPKIQEI